MQQGLNPKDLALCLSLTFYISIFPILGVITALLTPIILKLELNLPLALTVSYILTPIQLLVIIPFVRVGEQLYGADPYPFDLDHLNASFSEGFMEMFSLFSGRIMMAISGWLLIATPLCLLFYILIFQVAKWRLLNKL